jgi:hypothetical protein
MTATQLIVRPEVQTAVKKRARITRAVLQLLFSRNGAIATTAIGGTTLAAITPYGLEVANLGLHALDIVMKVSIGNAAIAAGGVVLLIGGAVFCGWLARATRQNANSTRALLNDSKTIDQ